MCLHTLANITLGRKLPERVAAEPCEAASAVYAMFSFK